MFGLKGSSDKAHTVLEFRQAFISASNVHSSSRWQNTHIMFVADNPSWFSLMLPTIFRSEGHVV